MWVCVPCVDASLGHSSGFVCLLWTLLRQILHFSLHLVTFFLFFCGELSEFWDFQGLKFKFRYRRKNPQWTIKDKSQQMRKASHLNGSFGWNLNNSWAATDCQRFRGFKWMPCVSVLTDFLAASMCRPWCSWLWACVHFFVDCPLLQWQVTEISVYSRSKVFPLSLPL